MSRQIFRAAALERLSTPEQLDKAMRVTGPTSWLAVGALVLLIGVALGWSVIGTVPIKVQGQGILISPGGVLSVMFASPGRVAAITVKPGDRVRSGQVVARLDQPELRQQLATAEAELAEQRSQLQRLQAFHRRKASVQSAVHAQKRSHLTQTIASSEERLRWLGERHSYEGELLAKGLIGRQRHIDTKIEMNTVKDQIAQSRNGLREIDLEEGTARIADEREVLDNELKISALSRKVESLREQFERLTDVKSEYDGRVVELKVNVGEVVANGVSLFSLLPDDDAVLAEAAGEAALIAVLYTAPTEGKKIMPGMPVEIAPSTVKREEYGFMRGRVRHVAEIPSTSEGMMRILKNQKLVESLAGKGAPFQVIVDLVPDRTTRSGFKWSSSRGPETEINTGTICDGAIAVRQLRLISLVIPALEQLFSGAGRSPGA
ncbi:MAG: NHLP bacteriocin system secretion protein [Alphaproteobacteria bacterium]|nr:NHLP bacteriocin system secretion protein [Alphaproteobacteria bacterium]